MAKHPAKSGWLKWLFGTLLVLGAIIFLVPLIYDQYQGAQQLKMARSYRKRLYPADQKRDALIRQFNANQVATQRHQTKPYPKVNIHSILPKTSQSLGNISIPSINLKAMPIYYGDSDAILAKGTGVMPFTSLPAPGKNVTSSVTGHTGLANRIFFDNIRYLKRGDVFYIDAFAHQLAYQVTKLKVIDPLKPDAASHFYVTKPQNQAILMTCTPIGINDHRLLVYGKRIPLKEAKQKDVTSRAALSPMSLWRDAIILLLILILLWWLWHHYRERRRRAS